MLETLNMWIATGFGLGHMPIAPGTFGTLLGVALAWGILGRPVRLQAALVGALLVLAVPVCHVASMTYAGADHGSIVADEYMAFPLALIGLRDARHPLVMACAFAVFRLFDGLKPFPIYLVETVDGGLGIMLDDVIAALCTWIVMAIGLALWRRHDAVRKE